MSGPGKNAAISYVSDALMLDPASAGLLDVLRRISIEYWKCRGRRNVYVGATEQMTLGLNVDRSLYIPMPIVSTC